MSAAQLWVLFVSGFSVSLLVTPLFIALAHKTGLVDHPAHRKIHSKPVAYLGGLAIFTALFLVMSIFVLLNLNQFSETAQSHFPFKNLAVFFAGTLMALWGLMDDTYRLKPWQKLIGQLVIAFAFAYWGFRFEVLHLPGLSPYNLPALVAVPLTVFWIVSLVNALNFVDGLDGLASSVAATSFFLLAAAAAWLGQWLALCFAFVVFSVLAGFLFYNWKPASVYLGESGSSGLGMLLAGFLLALGHKTPFLFQDLYPDAVGQPFHYQIIIVTLFAAYPALEISLSVARRLFRGKPIHRADQGHIHHRLLKKGWPVPMIVLAAVVFSILPGVAALATMMAEHGVAAWFFGLTCLVSGIGLPILGFLNFLQPHVIARSRPHYLIANHFINMQKLKLQLAQDQDEILTLINQTCGEFGVQGYRIFVQPNEKGMGGCHFTWEKSLEDQREHLQYLHTEKMESNLVVFKDHLAVNDDACNAFWSFEPHAEEEDLDVEYRVLVSEFMREVLTRLDLVTHLPQNHRLNLRSASHKKVSSTLLRRRRQS